MELKEQLSSLTEITFYKFMLVKILGQGDTDSNAEYKASYTV